MPVLALDRLQNGRPLALREVCFVPLFIWSLRERVGGVTLAAGRFAAEAEALCRAYGVDVRVTDAEEGGGDYADTFEGKPVTDLAALYELECALRRRINTALMARGVQFLDLDRAYIAPSVEIGEGSVVFPGAMLKGKTTVGRDTEIGPGCLISDCSIGDNCRLTYVKADSSAIGNGVDIGPFANIRPGCDIADGVHIGDFMELKKAKVGKKSKLSHLSYIGDAELGEDVNIGCGTVTVNYNGYEKNRTVIGDRAFIGCNTNLVAPVRVGAGAYTAAGSTVTDDVSSDALAIARARQCEKEGWATRHRAKYGK